MPILEKHEVQENRLWYRVEVTEEQAREFQEAYDSESEWPEWVWDLDWDHHWDKPGNDEVLSIRVLKEEEE
tara:strand:+ start:90 stop:302 length:213 start_codon:yes stop_codon:yes gene_type:complete